jgi:hypothetical protein
MPCSIRGARPPPSVEQQPAIVVEQIGEPEAQRQFGTDDGEVDLLAFGERADGVEVGEVDRKSAGQLGNTWISWCGDDFAHIALGGEAGDQRVLARAAAEDQNSHLENDLGGQTALHAGAGWRGLFR